MHLASGFELGALGRRVSGVLGNEPNSLQLEMRLEKLPPKYTDARNVIDGASVAKVRVLRNLNNF